MEGHRKIELQAPDDLAYLLANVRRAAAARLDEAFPPVDGASAGGEGDELRTRIEELVNEYITKTFKLASPNLSINGMPVNAEHFLSGDPSSAAALQPEEVFEPFDARKRARVEELSREEEDLLRDIAALKKSVPGAAAQAWAEAARKSVVDDEQALAVVNERASNPTSSTDENNNSNDSGGNSKLFEDLRKPLDRQDEIEGNYEDAVAGLGKLKREMPSVVAKMERARSAGEYVVTER
ncbi:uncharacterized protein GGS22DRAFT_158557 [Annulohypoxylon maeteangense]|uniref:uncharacterized protein n=1 Tax=Annulohypoxylon maeteangense TaxID=1927788 RepID=UPI002007ECDA|nr:uncharacterized protein GGS22DRAFT_158557 [Annulohypoxylon maeteangense]KAI0886726.1 hypothetical protein GGS22DRAFT_158557 [Annulohypoxylon maeteangense]